MHARLHSLAVAVLTMAAATSLEALPELLRNELLQMHAQDKVKHETCLGLVAVTAASNAHENDKSLPRRRHRPMVALTLRPMPCLERHRAEPGHDAGTARDRADHVRPRSPCTLADARAAWVEW